MQHNSEAKGEAFIIGISGQEGVQHDVENMMTRFLNVVAIYSTVASYCLFSPQVSFCHCWKSLLHLSISLSASLQCAIHGGVDHDNGHAYVLPLHFHEADNHENGVY